MLSISGQCTKHRLAHHSMIFHLYFLNKAKDIRNYDNGVIYMHTDLILYVQMAYYVVDGYITVDFTTSMVEDYITVDPLVTGFCLGSSVTKGYEWSIQCCLFIFKGQNLHAVGTFRPHHTSLDECNHHYKCSTYDTESRAVKWCFVG